MRPARRNALVKTRSVSGGGGLLNRAIDKLPVELHLPGGYRYCGPGTRLNERLARGDPGINKLDEFCKQHDIAYQQHKDTASRHVADKVLADRAWERFKAKDAAFGEKAAAWLVTTAMNVKSKIGAGKRRRKRSGKRRCGGGRLRKTKKVKTDSRSRHRISSRVQKRGGTRPLSFLSIVRHAKSAVKGNGLKSTKMTDRDKRVVTLKALKAVRLLKRGKRLRSGGVSRVLPLPKSGGFLPLLPIFAGLSAIGSLAGGAAGVAKAIAETKDAMRRLSELKRHNQSMEDIALRQGKGLFLRPYPKGGLGLYMTPYTKYAKNC